MPPSGWAASWPRQSKKSREKCGSTERTSPVLPHLLPAWSGSQFGSGHNSHSSDGLWVYTRSDFNPRPPRGGRPGQPIVTGTSFSFQSTPPARGATDTPNLAAVPPGISIHAPPRGGRRTAGQNKPRYPGISIHAPREGGDSKNSQTFKLFLQQSDNFYKYPLRIPAIFQK